MWVEVEGVKVNLQRPLQPFRVKSTGPSCFRLTSSDWNWTATITALARNSWNDVARLPRKWRHWAPLGPCSGCDIHYFGWGHSCLKDPEGRFLGVASGFLVGSIVQLFFLKILVSCFQLSGHPLNNWRTCECWPDQPICGSAGHGQFGAIIITHVSILLGHRSFISSFLLVASPVSNLSVKICLK